MSDHVAPSTAPPSAMLSATPSSMRPTSLDVLRIRASMPSEQSTTWDEKRSAPARGPARRGAATSTPPAEIPSVIDNSVRWFGASGVRSDSFANKKASGLCTARSIGSSTSTALSEARYERMKSRTRRSVPRLEQTSQWRYGSIPCRLTGQRIVSSSRSAVRGQRLRRAALDRHRLERRRSITAKSIAAAKVTSSPEAERRPDIQSHPESEPSVPAAFPWPAPPAPRAPPHRRRCHRSPAGRRWWPRRSP